MAIRIAKSHRCPASAASRHRRESSDANGKVSPKDLAAEAGTDVVAWVDERTGTSGFLRGFMFRKVPKGTNWFYTLGSATMFAFLSQAVTGRRSWRCTTTPTRIAPTTACSTSPTTCSWAAWCGACTAGARP